MSRVLEDDKWRNPMNEACGSESLNSLFLHSQRRIRCGADIMLTAYKTAKYFMRHERMPALEISVLVVSFFGFPENLKAKASPRQVSAVRTYYRVLRVILAAASIGLKLISLICQRMVAESYSNKRRPFTLPRTDAQNDPLRSRSRCISGRGKEQ